MARFLVENWLPPNPRARTAPASAPRSRLSARPVLGLRASSPARPSPCPPRQHCAIVRMRRGGGVTPRAGEAWRGGGDAESCFEPPTFPATDREADPGAQCLGA